MQEQRLDETGRHQQNGDSKGWDRTINERVDLSHRVQGLHKGWSGLHKGAHSFVDGLSNLGSINQRFYRCNQRISNSLLAWGGCQSILDIFFPIEVSIEDADKNTIDPPILFRNFCAPCA